MKRRVLASLLALTLCFSYSPAYAAPGVAEPVEAVSDVQEEIPAEEAEIEATEEIDEFGISENPETEETETTEIQEEVLTEDIPTNSTAIASGSFENDNDKTWEVVEESNGEYTLIITGSGAPEFDSWFAPWYEYIYAITKVTLSEGITSIPDSAFKGSPRLSEVELPASLERIGANAFRDCDALTAVRYAGDLENWERLVIDVGNTILRKSYYQSNNITPSEQRISGSCGENVEYELRGNVVTGYALTISGTGAMYRYSWSSPWSDYADYIYKVELQEGLTSIGEAAFRYCSHLSEIVLPDSVTYIGKAAFMHCDSLKNIEFPAGLQYIGVNAFEQSGLTSVTIPGNTELAANAFYWCDLKTVVLEEGVTEIPVACFSYCEKLTSISIPSSMQVIGDAAFNTCPSLKVVQYAGTPEEWSNLSIGYDNIRLVHEYYQSNHITPPDETITGSCGENADYELYGNIISGYSLTISGNGAMTDYDSWEVAGWDSPEFEIHSVTIKGGITRIGSHAFNDMEELCDVTIENGVKEIGTWAFSNCRKLKSVTVPASVKKIGEGAFAQCPSLEKVSLCEGLEEIGNHSFYDCHRLKECSIPSTVTRIGGGAFYACESMTEITLPAGLTTIENIAFANCTGLTAVAIPASVTTIDNSAFSECSNLAAVTIPKSVSLISYSAFSDCEKLARVNYSGSQKDWEAIEIYRGNDALRKAYYTSNSLVPQTERITGVCGENLTYTLTGDFLNGYALSITGTGPMYDFILAGRGDEEFLIPPWIDYIENIKSVSFAEGITYIGDSAFVCPFNACSVQKIIIPDTVTGIGNDAFDGWKNLEEITLPKSVGSIGSWAFRGCSSLKKVNYNGTADDWDSIELGDRNGYLDAAYRMSQGNPPSGICGDNVTFTMTGDAAQGYDVTISGTGPMWGFDYPGEAAWKYYPVRQVKIESGVTTIGVYAFDECSLSSVSIPDTVQDIEDGAFSFCRNLEGIRFPDSLVTIGNQAFERCENLKKVIIPAGVEHIGEGAFRGAGLTDLLVEEGVPVIDRDAFSGCKALKTVTLPESISSIDVRAFYDCSSITDVYYAGSESDWENVTIEAGNESILNAVIHCNYVDPSVFTITEQPQNVSAGVNGQVSFSVSAVNAASYQWQYSKNGGAKWINCSATGNKTDSISLKVTASNSVNIYRCVVTGLNGEKITSETAGVELLPGVVITLNPKSNAVAVGEYATFTVETENAAGFQWQYSKDGAHWYRSNAEGNKTDTLIVKGEQKSQGNRYRCVVTGIDGNTKKSYMAAMIVMTVAPKNCTAQVGETASYSLKAEGIATYQWQYSKDGGQSWYKSSAAGATTDTVTFTASKSNRAMIYRCKLTTPDEATAFTKPVGFE